MAVDGLAGIASGVDTTSIVQKLIALDQQQVDKIGWRKSAVTTRQSNLKDIASKLSALKLAGQDLASATTWIGKQTVDTSDATRVQAVKIGGAGIGGHSIQVDRLASSAQRGYAWSPNAAAGSIDLYYGADPTATDASKVTINVKANATAADVAAAINGTGSSPASAVVIKDPTTGADRVVLSARKSGDASAFTLDATNLSAGSLTEDSSYERSGLQLNAAYRMDGSATVLSSPSNVIENAIPGVRLTLKGITSTPASVNVSAPAIDTDAVKAKVKAFVDAYNAVVTATRADTSEKSVPNATNAADASKGQLFGDTGLLSMLSSLRTRMGSPIAALAGSGYDDLGDAGIGVAASTGTSTQDAKDGKLAIDDAKLDAALSADPAKVRSLFTSFSAGLDTYVKSQTNAGRGVLDARQAADDSELTSLTGQMTRAQSRITDKETRLKAQFAAMESAMMNTQTQTAWLTGQINQLG